MGDVVTKDFGKADREHARRLADLLEIVAANEADMLANPGKYLEMAALRLRACELLINRLYDAVHLPWMPSMDLGVAAPSLPPPMMQIDRRDYVAFQAVKLIINNAWNHGLLSERDAQPVDQSNSDAIS